MYHVRMGNLVHSRLLDHFLKADKLHQIISGDSSTLNTTRGDMEFGLIVLKKRLISLLQKRFAQLSLLLLSAVADPGFPVGGGVDLVGGARAPPRRLRFKNFACQNERIWTHRGGGGAPP